MSILPDVSSEQEVSTPAGRRRSSNIVEEQLRPVDIHNILNKSPSKKEVCFIILVVENLVKKFKNLQFGKGSRVW